MRAEWWSCAAIVCGPTFPWPWDKSTLTHYGSRFCALGMSQFDASPAQLLGLLALEQLNDLVYVCDRRAHVLYVNETACRMLCYTREELLAATTSLIGADDADIIDPGTGAAAIGWSIGECYTAEASLLSRDGHVIPVEVSGRIRGGHA